MTRVDLHGRTRNDTDMDGTLHDGSLTQKETAQRRRRLAKELVLRALEHCESIGVTVMVRQNGVRMPLRDAQLNYNHRGD